MATTPPPPPSQSFSTFVSDAFAPLLGLAPELEDAIAPEEPDILRARLLDNLTYARDNAVSSGVPLSRADQGAWFGVRGRF